MEPYMTLAKKIFCSIRSSKTDPRPVSDFFYMPVRIDLFFSDTGVLAIVWILSTGFLWEKRSI